MTIRIVSKTVQHPSWWISVVMAHLDKPRGFSYQWLITWKDVLCRQKRSGVERRSGERIVFIFLSCSLLAILLTKYASLFRYTLAKRGSLSYVRCVFIILSEFLPSLSIILKSSQQWAHPTPRNLYILSEMDQEPSVSSTSHVIEIEDG